jgi:hypothetical protein
MIKKILKILSLFSLIPKAYSHAFMKYPIVRRSKYSDYYLQNNLVDYNIASPLYDGYNDFTFPCKGFPQGPVITEINSNIVNIKLEPGIDKGSIHGGGHCQFGITYDNKNFIVLKQVIRDCLVNKSEYDLIIDNLPNKKVTIFWTWINAIGNREYYMDCADVIINIPNNNLSEYKIYGKELIILNILGFDTIPEFPDIGMYDGREYLENAIDKKIIFSNNPVTYPTIYSTTYPVTTSTKYPVTTSTTYSTKNIITSSNYPTLTTQNTNNDDKIISLSNKNKLNICIIFIYFYITFIM